MPVDLQLSVPRAFQGPSRHRYSELDAPPAHWSFRFRACKAVLDTIMAAIALPFIGFVACALLIINPFLNPGPFFFRQERLGQYRRPFLVWKFRTMREAAKTTRPRSAEDALDVERITPLGRLLRQSHIDELPNFINVMKGEMSVIGPRPDSSDHAKQYLRSIPHYAYRYMVKPGITGLAQVEAGYAEGTVATVQKAHYDQLYVETSCGRLDLWIALRTAYVVLTGTGAK
ncbi:MAG: sugar transferase [Pseudomonadota bacterium]